MDSLWDEAEASTHLTALDLRVYTSRLLGREPSLVLHGGGNTSVKVTEPDVFGQPQDVLHIKGSGWDLATIQPRGFAPVRLAHVLKLAELDALSDAHMARELRVATLNPAAPTPSVEAILHAILPHPFVDHSHADAIIAITNTAGGEARVREIYGDAVVVVPYVMPGFALAKVCADLYPKQAGPRALGMVLLNHGLFTFGQTACESYERHIELVSRAEAYLERHKAWHIPTPALKPRALSAGQRRLALATLRRDISQVAGAPVIMATHDDPQALTYAQRDDVAAISQRGPATPDHVIRTKRVAMIGRDVAAYADAYRAWFAQHAPRAPMALTMLDPAPRVVLDPELGLCVVGRSAKEAAVVEDIYRHTMGIVLRAEALGGYAALPAGDLFDVEYWDLEQAKLKTAGKPPVFLGEVALVTGAASGIGKACVEALSARGASVVALDINPAVAEVFPEPGVLGLRCDVTSEAEVAQALDAAVQAFGGLDMLVLNAGIFPPGRKIAELPLADWRKVLGVNLDSNLLLLREVHPLLKLAPNAGRIAIIGSKNVPAPGPGAAAYSASKAALTQLARVAALEWGGDGIRVNVVHPNAVFDTGIWTDDVLRSRAASYGLTVAQYKTNNVLRVEVTSRAVAELVAELCGPLFACTTGAQIPIDGGNDRVI